MREARPTLTSAAATRLMRAIMVCLVSALSAVTSWAQLTTAMQVRSLSAEDAANGYEVHVRGTVIFSDHPATIFIQDDTAGTFFRLGGVDPPQPGDEVEVRGRSQPGLYVPGIENATFQVIGHPGMPEARPVGFDDLMSGRYHYQWVEVVGVVRTVNVRGEAGSILRVAVGSRVLDVHVEVPLSSTGSRMVGARVRIKGLAAGNINHRRQLVSPYLRCSTWDEVEVLQAAASAEQSPELSYGALLNFSATGESASRVRVKGQVLAMTPEGKLYLRGDAPAQKEEDQVQSSGRNSTADRNPAPAPAAVAVSLVTPDTLIQIGDMVEVCGFPEMSSFSASLVDAEVLARQAGDELPAPLAVTLMDAKRGEYDNNLLVVEGVLADWFRGVEASALILQSGEVTLLVKSPDLPDDIVLGSLLRVTGIFQVESTRQSEYRSEAESVSLRLRSVDDIEVIGSPSWWTSERMLTLLMVAMVLVCLALLWIAMLRRQVARQTVALRDRIEREATLEERQRIARDFHDTLEQELAGLSLRIDAAVSQKAEGGLGKLLRDSRHLVSRIQTETRNLVSDLRDDRYDITSIEAALQDLVAQHPADLGPELALLPSDGALPEIPPRSVHHLKMVAREAITNAIKHAKATQIEVKVWEQDHGLILTVRDNGIGMEEEVTTRGTSGHFGCIGIRERAMRLGAEVSWHSTPGEGTELRLTMPLGVKLTR